MACGLGLSVYALTTWNAASFGRLNYPHTLRIVIPGEGAALGAGGERSGNLAIPLR